MADADDVQQAAEAVDDAGDPPPVKDHAGAWDEWLAGFIVAVPFVLLLAGGAWLLWTGRVPEVTGTIPATWVYLTALVLFGLPWLLAVAKVWGIKPVVWLANVARNYE